MTNLFDRTLARLGYQKTAAIVSPATWMAQTAKVQSFELPGTDLPTAHLDLYKRLSWVQAAVNNVAQAAALSAFEVMSLEAEKRVAIRNHPFETLLARPNPLQSRYEFLYATTAALTLTGNAFWFMNRPNSERPPIELWNVPSNRIVPVPNESSYLHGYMYDPGDGEEIPLELHEVVHFKRWHPLNDFVGLSPVEALAAISLGDIAMQQWNTNNFAKENAKIPGIMAFADPIADGEWAALKRDWQEQHGGTERRMTMIRNTGKGGVNWIPTAMSQHDMEFLAGRQSNKEEIFSMFAPGLAAVLAINSTEANANAGRRTFMESAVWPHMVAIAEKISNDVLPAYGDNLVGAFEDVRVTDRVLELSEIERFSSFHTIDEVRATYYDADPIGDERGDLLAVELTSGPAISDEPEPAQPFESQSENIVPEPEPDSEPEPEPEEDDDEAARVEAAKFVRWAEKRIKRKRPVDLALFKSDCLDADELADIALENGIDAEITASGAPSRLDATFPVSGWAAYP